MFRIIVSNYVRMYVTTRGNLEKSDRSFREPSMYGVACMQALQLDVVQSKNWTLVISFTASHQLTNLFAVYKIT